MNYCFFVNKENKLKSKKYIEQLYTKGYSWPSGRNFFPEYHSFYIHITENIKRITYGSLPDENYIVINLNQLLKKKLKLE